MIATPAELRRVFGCFATGVTVVSCRVGDRTHGITVNSFTSVSLEPPLILICIDRRTIAYTLLPEAGSFAVSVLSEAQRWICDYFARRLAPNPDDEFADIPHRAGETGAPVVLGAIAVIECRLTSTFPAGDHDIFVAEVVNTEILSDDSPLIFHRGKFPRAVTAN